MWIFSIPILLMELRRDPVPALFFPALYGFCSGASTILFGPVMGTDIMSKMVCFVCFLNGKRNYRDTAESLTVYLILFLSASSGEWVDHVSRSHGECWQKPCLFRIEFNLQRHFHVQMKRHFSSHDDNFIPWLLDRRDVFRWLSIHFLCRKVFSPVFCCSRKKNVQSFLGKMRRERRRYKQTNEREKFSMWQMNPPEWIIIKMDLDKNTVN